MPNQMSSDGWLRRQACVLAATAVFAVMLLVKAPSANAVFNVFGVRAFNYQKYGSSVSIEVPPSDPAPDSQEFVLHRAVVQSDYGSTAGLVQVGVYRSGTGIQLDSCGARTGWTFFGEWKAAGTPNEPSSYHCQLFSETDHGNNTVEHIWRWNEPTTNEWEMEINNSHVATYKPSFGVGYPQIGGEIAGVHSLPATSVTQTPYGVTRPWHSYNGLGKSGEFEIKDNSNTTWVKYSNWLVSPVPSPVTVEHWYP
jgi:hypothetical protein